jgi:ribonuclease P protein component
MVWNGAIIRITSYPKQQRDTTIRFSVVVGKRSIPTAVKRNYFRRTVYDAVRSFSGRFSTNPSYGRIVITILGSKTEFTPLVIKKDIERFLNDTGVAQVKGQHNK